MKKINLLFFLLSSLFYLSQQTKSFRLDPIENKRLEGFETEGCSFMQSKNSKDKILLMSFNGYVAAKISGKIFIADFSFDESGEKATFIGNQINGYINLKKIGRNNNYSDVYQGLLTIIYKEKRREIPLYGNCDNY